MQRVTSKATSRAPLIRICHPVQSNPHVKWPHGFVSCMKQKSLQLAQTYARHTEMYWKRLPVPVPCYGLRIWYNVAYRTKVGIRFEILQHVSISDNARLTATYWFLTTWPMIFSLSLLALCRLWSFQRPVVESQTLHLLVPWKLCLKLAKTCMIFVSSLPGFFFSPSPWLPAQKIPTVQNMAQTSHPSSVLRRVTLTQHGGDGYGWNKTK